MEFNIFRIIEIMLKEIGENLREIYLQDMNLLVDYLKSLPDSESMLEWKKRLRSSFDEDAISEDLISLDNYDWSQEEIFRASFALMALRTWSDYDKEVCEELNIKEVKLSELLELYNTWHNQDCQEEKIIQDQDNTLYIKAQNDYINTLKDFYNRIQRRFWGQEQYLTGSLVFGDTSSIVHDERLWKKLIVASELPLLLTENNYLVMPYKLIRDI